MNIPYTRHTLDNGLDVLIHEDHGCPIVAVGLWTVGCRRATRISRILLYRRST